MPSAAKYHLAILASGGGSNADRICFHFENHPHIRVSLILTNRSHAGVLNVAARHVVPSRLVTKKDWDQPERILPILQEFNITHIILAGFLLLIPAWMLEHFPHRILNIHPALLPKHGGKGMFGHHVHEAVKKSGELETGITIHEIDEQYDKGRIVFQKDVKLEETDSPEEIAAKVLKVEHAYYPVVIEKWITGESVRIDLRH